jgi:DNA-binding NarL/FixJ family response regulator
VGTRPIRVLVVDDDEGFRHAVGALLDGDARFRVVGYAGNGADGLTRALLLRPDLITMDIEMPVMDGVDATRRILEQMPGARVLLVSASVYAERAETARAAGAAGYLTKSRAADELADAIIAAAAGDEFVLAL